MAEHTCVQCYHFNWKTMLRTKPEPPECRIKFRLGWVHDTDPACEKFEPKREREAESKNDGGADRVASNARRYGKRKF